MSSEADTSTKTLRFRNKLLCTPDPNNITYIFIPFMSFTEMIENTMNMAQGFVQLMIYKHFIINNL